MLKEVILIILLLFIGIIFYFHATTTSIKEGLLTKSQCTNKLDNIVYNLALFRRKKDLCTTQKEYYSANQQAAIRAVASIAAASTDPFSPYFRFLSTPNYAKLLNYSFLPWTSFVNNLSDTDDVEAAVSAMGAFCKDPLATPAPSSSPAPNGSPASAWSIGQTPQCISMYNKNPTIDPSNISLFQQCYVAPVQQSIALVGNYIKNIDPDTASNTNLLNIFTQDVQNANTAIAEISNNSWQTAATEMNTNYNILQSDISNLMILSNISPYSFINLSEGGTLLTEVESKITNNTCAPLIDPSYNTQQLSILNKTLQQNKNILADLEKQIENIKSRYPIQFSVGSVLTNNTEKAQPELSIYGQLPNPVLNFLLLVPVDGQHGIEGKRGSIGPNGNLGENGSIGLQGYWGQNSII